MSQKTTRSNSNSFTIDESVVEILVNKLVPKLNLNIEGQLDKLCKKFDKLDAKMENMITQLSSVSSLAEANKIQIEAVQNKIESLERDSRQNSLILAGLNENLLSRILSLLNEGMKVECSHWEINNIYRIGKRNDSNTRPRIVVVSFGSMLKRNEVYHARKSLKDTGVFVNENLTKKANSLLRVAWKKYGRQAAWSNNGRIFVKRGNTVKIVREETDLNEPA